MTIKAPHRGGDGHNQEGKSTGKQEAKQRAHPGGIGERARGDAYPRPYDSGKESIQLMPTSSYLRAHNSKKEKRRPDTRTCTHDRLGTVTEESSKAVGALASCVGSKTTRIQRKGERHKAC
eukprot:1160235-Pelagomonas_calceolata.AAC.3